MKKILVLFLVASSYGIFAQTETKSDSTSSDHPIFRISSTESNALQARPLYLVNGVQKSEKDISKISPSNIESITVLKDSASVSQYGKKARFGVVKISLKKYGIE